MTLNTTDELMTQSYAPNETLVDALHYSGTPEDAIAVARWANRSASITIKDGETVLLLSRRPIAAPCWIVRQGSRYRAIDDADFAAGFTPVGPAQNGRLSSSLPSANLPSAPRAPGGLNEGDFVCMADDPKQDEFEIMELSGTIATLDGPWGESMADVSALQFVRTGP